MEDKHYLDTWLGSILGKVDRARKEQKRYAIAIMLLQVITLLAILSARL